MIVNKYCKTLFHQTITLIFQQELNVDQVYAVLYFWFLFRIATINSKQKEKNEQNSHLKSLKKAINIYIHTNCNAYFPLIKTIQKHFVY